MTIKLSQNFPYSAYQTTFKGSANNSAQNLNVQNNTNNLSVGQNKLKDLNSVQATNTNPFNSNFPNAPKLSAPSEKDVVELPKNNSKKAFDYKKLLLAFGAAALAIGGCVGLVKAKKVSNVKKDLTQLYNTIFEEISRTCPEGMNFEKPELVFKKLPKCIGGGYIPNNNQIIMDPKAFLKNKFAVANNLSDGVGMIKIAGGVEIPCGIEAILDNKKEARLRWLTYPEKLANTGKTLYHELTHAKQFQLALNMKGGAEALIEGFREKHPELSEKEFKEAFPFLFSYKPQRLLSANTIVENIKGKDGQEAGRIWYDLKNIVDAFTKYADPEKAGLDYYTNLTELSARNGELRFWQKIKDGTLPKPDGVSEDFIERNITCTLATVKILIKEANKILAQG